MAFLRAKEGAQTLDPQLGRLMLYQLSYFRNKTKTKWQHWASRGIRTRDPLITNQLLWPTELYRQLEKRGERRIRTSEVVRQLSYSQSHLATLVSPRDFYYVILIYSPYRFKERFEPVGGFEPATRWLQISCSGQLSYTGKWVSLLYRTATTIYPCCRQALGGFERSWSYRTYPPQK